MAAKTWDMMNYSSVRVDATMIETFEEPFGAQPLSRPHDNKCSETEPISQSEIE
jgi:hypothetical protein